MPAAATVPLERCGCCGGEASEPAGVAQGRPLRRCSGCGTLRFEAVAASDVVYRDGYHTGESEYGWDYSTGRERAYEEALADARIAWLTRRHPPGRLLDVGGGLGYLVAAAQRAGWRATLLEPVAQAVEHARTELGVDALQGGAESLAGLDGGWDVVSLVHSLEHLTEPLQTLRDATRLLAPGGMLFVEVPNHASLARRLQGDWWLGWQAGEHVHIFDRRTLTELVERAGLEPVAVRSSVPGWAGMLVDGYAHMLGLQRALWSATGTRRRLAARARGRQPGAGGDGEGPPPVVVGEARGARGLVYGRGFPLLARAEELLGLGTNLQLLARPAAAHPSAG